MALVQVVEQGNRDNGVVHVVDLDILHRSVMQTNIEDAGILNVPSCDIDQPLAIVIGIDGFDALCERTGPPASPTTELEEGTGLLENRSDDVEETVLLSPLALRCLLV